MEYNEMLEMIEIRISENEQKIQESLNTSNENSYLFYTGKNDALYELRRTIKENY